MVHVVMLDWWLEGDGKRQQVMFHSSSSSACRDFARSCVRKQQSQDTDSSSQKVLVDNYIKLD